MDHNHSAIATAALAVALAAGATHAQKFERALGSANAFEQAFDIDIYDDAGGYVTVGDFVLGGENGIQVVRYGPLGNRLWNRVYIAELHTTGFSIETARNGDILVAGMTDTTAGGGLSTIVMRLRPDGAVIWSNRYAGTFGTDGIHTPQPGPALIEAENEDICVVTNFQGAPTAMRLRPGGAVIWSWIYFDPSANGDDRQNRFAFTDIKNDRDNTFAISGTVRITDPNLGLPFVDLQDPMILRIKEDGSPESAAHYNLHPNLPIDILETGDGLDVNRQTADIVVAGRTNRPSAGAPLAQHWVIAATDLSPIRAANFAAGNPQLDSTTGYSSVRYSLDQREFAVVGAYAPPGGEATIHGFDESGVPLWRWHSADQAQLDGLVPAFSCGYLATGRIGGFLTGGIDDIFHIKTNDSGQTGCSRENDFEFDPLEPRRIEFPVELGEAPFSEEFPVTAFVPPDEQPILCLDTECDPCIPDWNNDGVLDFFDVLGFLGDFAAMNPNADLNNDGVWDFFDLQLFLQAFSDGCP